MTAIDSGAPTAPSDVEPHLFVSWIRRDERFCENVLRFVEDNGLTLTLDHQQHHDAEWLDSLLAETRDRDIDVMLNAGRVDGYSSGELAESADKRAELTDRMMGIVDIYAKHYPEGRIYCWHEAPIKETWDGDDRDERAESVAEHGPAIFAAQKTAVTDAYPEIDVGIFIHNPFIAPPSHTNKPIFGRLMDALGERPGDVLPDFTYCDVYRGYYEWETGYESVNDYLAAVLENVREQTDGRPVHYLGEAHTINNNYTPSKQSILGNLRTALETSVEGYGWYFRGSFRETHRRNFDPFLPNTGSVVQEDLYNSWIGSRDRLRWALLRLLEVTDTVNFEDRFDLWLHGEDLSFYDHRLFAHHDGDWEFVGDFSGYVDGDNPYSGHDRTTVTAFCGLDREYLEGGLELKVATDPDSDGAELRNVYALPHVDTANYVPEPEAATLVENTEFDVASVCLGHDGEAITLSPAEEATLSLTIGDPDRPLSALPGWKGGAEFDRLREIESGGPTVGSSRFDLWVYGDRIAGSSISLAGEDVSDRATSPDATSLDTTSSDATSSDAETGQTIVVRGLEKERFYEVHRGGGQLDLRIEPDRDDARVRAAYALPYHGTRNFTTPAEAASVIEREHTDRLGQIAQFCIGSAAWPVGTDRDVYETELQLVYRRLVERTGGSNITM